MTANPHLTIATAGSSTAGIAATPSLRWFAARCLSHREPVAVEHLRRQGFGAFLPLRRKTRRHARKEDVVLTPFFPGYLFVRLDIAHDRWRSINSTRGISSLVMQGDLPAVAAPGVIESLQRVCDPDGVVNWEPELKIGEAVRVVSGAFADFIGQLDRLDANGRVRVLLEIMGGRVPTFLPRQNIVSASSVI